MFKVERFRRWLPGRGSQGAGLVQFYGPRATRSYDLAAKAPAWDVDARGPNALHTVELADDVKIK